MTPNCEVFEDDVFKPTPLKRPHASAERCTYPECGRPTGKAVSKEGRPLCLDHWLEEHA